jgi:hypothetical protein
MRASSIREVEFWDDGEAEWGLPYIVSIIEDVKASIKDLEHNVVPA